METTPDTPDEGLQEVPETPLAEPDEGGGDGDEGGEEESGSEESGGFDPA